MGASNILNRARTLVNVEYGEDLGTSSARGEPTSYTDLGSDTACGEASDYTNDLRSDYSENETWAKPNLRSSFANSQSGYTNPRSDYPNSETWAKPNLKNSLVSAMRKVVTSIQKEYIDEEREGF